MSAVRAVKSEAAEQKKKIIAGVAFGIVAAGLLYFELSDPNPKAPPVASVVVSPGPTPTATANAVKSGALVTAPPGYAAGAAARTVGSTSAALDPTLHMEAMLVTESVVYTGSGRNIFAGGKDAVYTPPVIPKVIAPVRTTGQTGPAYVQPPPQPSGPPPINLKFFGIATTLSNGHRQAFLLHGDDVFLASDGDIVQRKYRVISVGANSVQIEDMTNNNRQTLPLLVAP